MITLGDVRRSRISCRTVVSIALLLCVAAAIGSAQVRRPTRPGIRAPSATTPPTPPPVLSAFTLSVDSISGKGTPLVPPTGKVTLSGPAPAGGFGVTLSASDTAATVPVMVTVAAGSTTVTFPITAKVVAAPTPVQITARAGATSLAATIKVLLSVISVLPEAVPGPGPGGGTVNGWRVTMSGPAPPPGITVRAGIPGGVIGSACYPAPTISNAIVAAGQTSGVFTVQTAPSMYRPYGAAITYGGRSVGLSPPYAGFAVFPPALAAVDVPTSIAGGTTAYGNVRLSSATPNATCAGMSNFAGMYDQYYTFYFSSSAASIQVPASARVDPGQSERPFQITALAVQTPQTVTITVSRRSANNSYQTIKQLTITVTP